MNIFKILFSPQKQIDEDCGVGLGLGELGINLVTRLAINRTRMRNVEMVSEFFGPGSKRLISKNSRNMGAIGGRQIQWRWLNQQGLTKNRYRLYNFSLYGNLVDFAHISGILKICYVNAP